MKEGSGHQICYNRRARHEYNILETYECGVVLQGTEVKSIRLGNTSLTEAYAQIKQGEVWLYGWQISKYEQGNIFNSDPLRAKKLILHRREINKLANKVKLNGLTLVPLSLYFKNNHVKLELALASGKKLYDKREDMKKKAVEREVRSKYAQI
ncbi:SsrA-binding protein SmpB [Amygdalobacter nucleatus]|uniref:SsrA-binding protein n=1 Tax=Amygdalobacter nucleatus TaxID=3029274 RepID=A0A133YGS7_9FIRM|nr:SsrA-binding protein SmpB [Amygdalobacter nucleatus]KXB42388.1 SsrA-binding protein [Amygdalobacter nucleatus]MDF0485964.1 SsrA-binding protein SmpB [Amygdalobacter nucleatus]WEG37478.1 SsrA-binding protein SmpB [Amygdalobacter nucleatus]